MRKTIGCIGIALLLVGLTRPRGQAPESAHAFDVVSIKADTQPTSVAPAHFTVRNGGYLTIANTSLRAIISTAYELQDYQLLGGADAITRSSFDVEARAAGMPPLRYPPAFDNPAHPVYPLLRAMLAERFKLAVHHETRDFPAYALVVARPDGRLGPQLAHSTTDCSLINAARGTDNEVKTPAPNGAAQCGMNGSVARGIRIAGDSLAMPFVINSLISSYAGRPVVDRTGLTGLYTFTIEFSPDSTLASNELPSFFTALEEQLGLKLQPTTASLDVVVIDHVERPSED